MTIKSVLITGGNRGLGLGMVKRFLKENVPYVFATCRNQNCEELLELQSKHKNLRVLELDVSDFKSFASFAAKVKEEVKDVGLNLLINNAGITVKFTRIQLVKAEQLLKTFEVNTVAPILLTKEFLPLLKQASANNEEKQVGIERAAVINISSERGSIEMNNTGGSYPYRCSKAAINAATRSMGFDLKDYNILAVAIHPGWVTTDMGGKNAPLDVETCIDTLFKTMKTFTAEDSGKFIQYDGEKLPW